MILSYGALHPLIDLINKAKQHKDDAMVKSGIWALSNLCRGTPLPPFHKRKDALPVFSRALQEESDLEVLSDASWCLLHMVSEDNPPIDSLVNTGIIPSLIRHLE